MSSSDLQIVPASDSSQADPIASNSQTSQTVGINDETLDRIKNLAYVGNALYSVSNDVNFNTDYFVAKESLNKFKEGIMKLNLQGEMQIGIENLIKFLEKELEKVEKNVG